MKKTAVFLLGLVLLYGCRQTKIEKPANLISEDKMVDIIYDLSLLEAIKSVNNNSFEEKNINPATYIYKKYKIDSVQFVKSDLYYASDIDGYSHMYERVNKRLERNKKKADSLARTNNKPRRQPIRKDNTIPEKKRSTRPFMPVHKNKKQ